MKFNFEAPQTKQPTTPSLEEQLKPQLAESIVDELRELLDRQESGEIDLFSDEEKKKIARYREDFPEEFAAAQERNKNFTEDPEFEEVTKDQVLEFLKRTFPHKDFSHFDDAA
ncbi:hypothetical protein H6776_01410 [Candidatus Nomurabacteria bacterium]|nr:hypothetical protein [Candidatus Nomurabacteria bacterium]